MARARGERHLTAGVFESTEKTAPGSGFFHLPVRSNGLSLEQGLLEDDIVGTRDPGDADLDNPVAAGDVGIPIDLEAMGFWLKGLLGAASTTEDTGVYTHVFESGSWSLPSFSLEKQLPDVPSYEMFRGCRAGRLQMAVQRGGRLNGTVNVIAQGSDTPAGTSSAGTPDDYTLQRFMQYQTKIQIDGSDTADVVSLNFDYNNNLDAVETVTSDGYIGGLDPMRASIAANMRLRFASESLFTTAKADTSVALSIIATISADAKLTLAMPRVFLSVPGRPIEGPGGIEADFQIMAARDTDDSAMLTATLINEVASY
jgi:hypothetical protein